MARLILRLFLQTTRVCKYKSSVMCQLQNHEEPSIPILDRSVKISDNNNAGKIPNLSKHCQY